MESYMPSAGEQCLPIAYGRVTGPRTWFADERNPAMEVANVRIHVTCPTCGRENIHGWRLDGFYGTERYVEVPKASHCECPKYLVRPRDGANHDFDPASRLTRIARRSGSRGRHVDNC